MITKKLAWWSGILLLAAIAGGQPGEAPEEIVYEVVQVKRKLFRVLPAGEERLATGARLRSGEVLRTGWLSQADLAAPAYKAAFRLAARTRVRLAHERPGVLLELEKGRLRAIFEALGGDDPPARVVRTPSAILAVRGTEYGVSVNAAGDTTVVVFTGVVEVSDRARRGEAVEVAAGFFTTVRRGQTPSAPQSHRLNRRGWDRGTMPGSRRMGSQGSMGQGGGVGGSRQRGHGRGHGGGSMGHGG